ncbi:hypothetical protein M5689_022406 [Euphorbia peplus]|nr:hypothetical protein M5689_022406 [Euphorbia peplus]
MELLLSAGCLPSPSISLILRRRRRTYDHSSHRTPAEQDPPPELISGHRGSSYIHKVFLSLCIEEITASSAHFSSSKLEPVHSKVSLKVFR